MKYLPLTILAVLCLSPLHAQETGDVQKQTEIKPPETRQPSSVDDRPETKAQINLSLGFGNLAIGLQGDKQFSVLKGWLRGKKRDGRDTKDQTPNQRIERPQRELRALDQLTTKVDWDAVERVIQSGKLSNFDALKKEAWTTKDSGNNSVFLQQMDRYVEQGEALDLPLLIPISAVKADNTQLVTRSTSYSFNADYPDGVYVDLMSMCSGYVLPDGHRMAPKKQETQSNPFNQDHTGEFRQEGYVVSFPAFGCGYQVNIACARGCEPKTIANEIINDLGVLNAK